MFQKNYVMERISTSVSSGQNTRDKGGTISLVLLLFPFKCKKNYRNSIVVDKKACPIGSIRHAFELEAVGLLTSGYL
jgi:hypothetical protein